MKKSALAPVSQFRIYPFGKYLYFKVKVFRTLRDLREYATELLGGSKKENAGTLAMCIGEIVTDDNGAILPVIGELLFCQKHMDPDTVSHELFHAALRLAERKGWSGDLFKENLDDQNSDAEEYVAYAVGRMTSQMNRKIKKLSDRGS